jgi:hypothetical protein
MLYQTHDVIGHLPKQEIHKILPFLKELLIV